MEYQIGDWLMVAPEATVPEVSLHSLTYSKFHDFATLSERIFIL